MAPRVWTFYLFLHSSFLLSHGWYPEQGYMLQMESDTFTHSLKGLLCAPGSEVSFFPTINSLPL